MRISELLQKESIALGRKPQDKADAIGQMVELLAKSGSLEDKKKFKQAILERERLSTTGIGEGIAIPHGKSSAVKRAAGRRGLLRRQLREKRGAVHLHSGVLLLSLVQKTVHEIPGYQAFLSDVPRFRNNAERRCLPD